MKVIDIIKSPLNEGALSQIAIRELSDAAGWAIARAQKYGNPLPRISDILRREGVTATSKELAVIEKEAAKRAAEITKAETAAFDKQNSLLNKTMAGTKEIGEGLAIFKEKISFITNALIALGCTASVGDAVWTYYSNVQEAYDQWAAGKLPEADYRYVRQAEMSVMITKIAGTFVFVGGTGAIAGILNFFGKIPFLGVPFRLLGGLTKVGQLALAAAFNTPQAKEWMAYAAVYHLSELPIIGPLFKFLGVNDDISAYVGGGGVLLLDKLKAILANIPGVGGLMDKTPGAVDVKQDQKPVNPANDKADTGPATVPANNPQSITAPQDDANTVKLPSGEWIRTDGNKWRSPSKGDISITTLDGGVWIRKDGNKWLNTSTGGMYVSKDPNKLSNIAPVGPDGVPTRLLK